MTARFGSMIREYRLALQWTQAELAEALGYENAQFVSLLERDQSKVPLSTLGQLIVLLKIPEHLVVEELLQNYENNLTTEIKKGKEVARNKNLKEKRRSAGSL